MSIQLILFIGAVAFLGYALWRRKKKKAASPGASGGNGRLYIKLVSEKIGEKKPPDRLWPEPFSSVQEIESWWEERSDLWTGVDHVELADYTRKDLWQK